MKSAFEKPIYHGMKEERNPYPPGHDSETEDEEVRLNCIAGIQRDVDDISNVNKYNQSNEEDDSSASDEPERENEPSREGVVTFVNVPAKPIVNLVRPKASPPLVRHPSPYRALNESSSSQVEGLLPTPDRKFVVDPDSQRGESVDENATNDDDCHYYTDRLSETHYHADGSDYSDDEDTFEDDVDADADRNDFELSDILQSLGDVLECEVDESETSGPAVRFIGVMEDRLDPINIPKAKRVLSFNTLSALNAEADKRWHSIKRQKSEKFAPVQISAFDLGPSAIMYEQETHRECSPLISSSDDEDLDRQLEEELGEHGDFQMADSSQEEDKPPIPLLTPPTSPLTLEVDGCSATICEWPSNLTVDSAMQAVNELRPLSPASLEILERDEQDRVGVSFGDTAGRGTFLTPLLQGVSISQ